MAEPTRQSQHGLGHEQPSPQGEQRLSAAMTRWLDEPAAEAPFYIARAGEKSKNKKEKHSGGEEPILGGSWAVAERKATGQGAGGGIGAGLSP